MDIGKHIKEIETREMPEIIPQRIDVPEEPGIPIELPEKVPAKVEEEENDRANTRNN